MSRFAAIVAAVALVLSGIAIGALGTFLVLDRHHRPRGPLPPQLPPPPAPFSREMEARLDLTDNQREQIHTILRESRDQAEAIRRELRPRIDKHLEETRAKICALLTPEQRTKFEEMVKNDRKRAERAFIEGPPLPFAPPPPTGPPGPPGPPEGNRPLL